ncbi:MAG TPA: type II secretion system F family protein [Phycisphaerales bacterium]|nr:type II secretion system F family protein [Phycisphaerales bacterium]
MSDPRLIMNVIIVVALFGLLASLWFGLLMLLSLRRAARAKAMEQRLGIGEGADDGSGRVIRLWLDGKLASTVVRGDDEKPTFEQRMHVLFVKAGFEGDPKPFVMSVLGFSILGGVLGWMLTQSVVVAAGACMAVVVGGWWYLGARVDKREALFEHQFVDAMGLAARSLRAGHPLLGAFQLISDELADPVKTLFSSICQQHTMGLKLEEAIERVAATTPNKDVQLFATAVTIQLRSGGNLADVMERLASVIRDRVRIGRRIKVLTAQTQFSKRVLIALPIILFVVLNVINQEYMKPLIKEPVGQLMLAIAGVNMILGVWVMNKLSELKY